MASNFARMNVSISEEQKEYVKEKDISPSKLLRDAIEGQMQKDQK